MTTLYGTNPNGATTASASAPVTLATDDALVAAAGAKADSAASTDTGTFSLIALVKRLLSKLTTQLPASLGSTTASASLPVVIASDQAAVASKVAGVATNTAVSLASGSSSAQVAAANSARRGLNLTNTDPNVCYINFGAAASVTAFVARLEQYERFEAPDPCYTGTVNAIWAADGAGSLIGSELAT